MNPAVLDELFAHDADAALSNPPGHIKGEDHVYLVAGTPFEQYRDFLLKEIPDSGPDRVERLSEDWRRASRYLSELRLTESAWADNPDVLPLATELEPLAQRVRSEPIFEKAFRLPVTFGVVELDRLVVRQELVNLAQVARLKQGLGPNPGPEKLFSACLPLEHPPIGHGVRALDANTFVFSSDSNDLRFLEPVLLQPEQVQGVQTHGTILSVVGLLVGYGSNYLNVIAAEGRMVLHNGSHRAFALRDLGLTHVPCVIQHASNRQQLLGVAAGALRKNPDFYLQQPRPPVLKDYFDPRLRQILRLARIDRHVKIHFTVDSYDVIKE